MRFRFGAIALALLLALVAAGCGKKKVVVVETTATAPPVATTATTATTSGGSTGTTTEDNGSSNSGSGAPKGTLTKDCAQLLSLGQKFSAAVQAASGGGSAEAVAKEVQLFKELADASPSEIHGDFETIPYGSKTRSFMKSIRAASATRTGTASVTFEG